MCDTCGCQLHEHHQSDSKIVEVNQSLLELEAERLAIAVTKEEVDAVVATLSSRLLPHSQYKSIAPSAA